MKMNVDVIVVNLFRISRFNGLRQIAFYVLSFPLQEISQSQLGSH